MAEYNINNDMPIVEFWFSNLKQNVEYTFTFYDFNHPTPKPAYVTNTGYAMSYLVWSCMSDIDLLEEGIAKDTIFCQNIPEASFRIAYGQYRWMSKAYRDASSKLSNENITVSMTFVKKTKKIMKILDIKIID